MKQKTITGIVIDPDTQEIKAVTFPNNLAGYYELLGCELIDRVPLNLKGVKKRHDLIVDDEGLYKGYKTVFSIVGVEGMFVGKAVIVGVDLEEGEWIDCTLESVAVQFYRKKEGSQDGEEGSSSQD